MNSPSNLMNYPDAFGQYYHPTPTPTVYYGRQTTEPEIGVYYGKQSVNTEEREQNTDYYYQTSEVSLFSDI